VDIATNWWEGEAIAVRSQRASKEGLGQIRASFPFRIRGLHPDNDSVVNDLLLDCSTGHESRKFGCRDRVPTRRTTMRR